MRRTPLWALVLILLAVSLVVQGESAGLCSVFKTWGASDVLTASDLNNSMTQAAVTNSTLQCVSGYSASVAQMQVTADPFPSGTESLSAAAADELARLRFVVQKLTGWTQWYKYPDRTAIPNFNFTQNGDVELWSAGASAAPDGWTLSGAGATIAKNTTAGQFKFGAASASVTRVGADALLFQDVDLISGFGPVGTWQGKTVTFGGWVRATVAARCRIQVNDGVGTTSSAYHTGDSTLQFLRVTATLNVAATRVRIQDSVDTGDTTCQFDAALFVLGSIVSDFVPSGPAAPVGIPNGGLVVSGCNFSPNDVTAVGSPAGETQNGKVWMYVPSLNCFKLMFPKIVFGPGALDATTGNIALTNGAWTALTTGPPAGPPGFKSGMVQYIPTGRWGVTGYVVVSCAGAGGNFQIDIRVTQGTTLDPDTVNRPNLLTGTTIVVGGSSSTTPGVANLPIAIPVEAPDIQFNAAVTSVQATEIIVWAFAPAASTCTALASNANLAAGNLTKMTIHRWSGPGSPGPS